MGLASWFRGALGGKAPVVRAADAAPPPSEGPRQRLAKRWAIADGLQNLSAGLGDPSRDKRAMAEYTLNSPISRYTLEAMYLSSWLAARIVNTPADDMTREWVSLSWDGHDDGQEDDQAIRDLENDLDMRNKVNEALQWARLYGGSSILIGLRGEDLGSPLDPETVKQGSLDCLLVYDRWWIFGEDEVDLDVSSRNFGLPLYYRMADSQQRVHWTRVVRFTGRKLPRNLWLSNGCWDASELSHVIDNIKDYDSVRASIASMAWESNVDVLGVGGLADMLGDDGGAALVQKRFQLAASMKSFNRMLIIDKDTEEFHQKQTQFGGIKDVLDKFILDVSGAADIPIIRLFGQTPSGISNSGDNNVRNYYDHIASKQQTQLRAQLFRLYQVVVRSAIGSFPENFKVNFNPLWQISATEQASIQKTNADRDAIYLGQGVVTEGLVARQLKQDNVYSTMEDDDVELAEELALEPDPVPIIMPPGGGPPVPGAPAPGTPGAAEPAAEEPPAEEEADADEDAAA